MSSLNYKTGEVADSDKIVKIVVKGAEVVEVDGLPPDYQYYIDNSDHINYLVYNGWYDKWAYKGQSAKGAAVNQKAKIESALKAGKITEAQAKRWIKDF